LSITRRKFCYLVVLNEKFLTTLAAALVPQIDQVLLRIGITLADYLVGNKLSVLMNVLHGFKGRNQGTLDPRVVDRAVFASKT
jgi:hypothetical protein